MTQHDVNDHRLTAGGFGLRLEAGSIGPSADFVFPLFRQAHRPDLADRCAALNQKKRQKAAAA